MCPCSIFYNYWFDAITPGKNINKKKNTHPWSIFWQKFKRFHILQMGNWNFYKRVLGYPESDCVIFIKNPWLLGGASPFFRKWGKFSQARSFWRVTLNLMNLIYFLGQTYPFTFSFHFITHIIVRSVLSNMIISISGYNCIHFLISSLKLWHRS
jgi:hypothetical protein